MTKEEIDKEYSTHAASWAHIHLTLIPDLITQQKKHEEAITKLKAELALLNQGEKTDENV